MRNLTPATRLLFGFTEKFTRNKHVEEIWAVTRNAVIKAVARTSEEAVQKHLLEVAYSVGGFRLWLIYNTSNLSAQMFTTIQKHKTIMDISCPPPPMLN